VRTYKKNFNTKKCDTVVRMGEQTAASKDQQQIRSYYDLVTDFYEFGWGRSFHFCPQFAKESRQLAMQRHQLRLAEKLKLKPGMRVLDAGCGVGGPLLNIARHSGAHITGLNICEYQLAKARRYAAKARMQHQTDFVVGDFMNAPLSDASFDAIYTIEASVHAKSRLKCFQEMHRLLKPGGVFAGYEYVVTERYDENNPLHVSTMRKLEDYSAVQQTPTIQQHRETLQAAGFKILQLEDMLKPGMTFNSRLKSSWVASPIARALTKALTFTLEKLSVAPKGATKVSQLLNISADGYADAGELEIFSPCLLFVAYKETA